MFRLLLVLTLCSSAALMAVKLEGPMPARNGETCAVCNMPVTDKDVAYLVDGQRVAVMETMQEEFLQNPLLYVTKFRPEGMVFSARQSGSLNSGYLWLGMYVLVGLLFGGACAHVAMTKGLPSWRWFFLGFFFSVPACLAVAARQTAVDAPAVPEGLGKIPVTRDPVAAAVRSRGDFGGGSSRPSAMRKSSWSRCDKSVAPMSAAFGTPIRR